MNYRVGKYKATHRITIPLFDSRSKDFMRHVEVDAIRKTLKLGGRNKLDVWVHRKMKPMFETDTQPEFIDSFVVAEIESGMKIAEGRTVKRAIDSATNRLLVRQDLHALSFAQLVKQIKERNTLITEPFEAKEIAA